jgi:hypothetical protein
MRIAKAKMASWFFILRFLPVVLVVFPSPEMVGAGYPFWNPSFVYRFRESLVWGGSDAEQESSTRPAKALDHLHGVRRLPRSSARLNSA